MSDDGNRTEKGIAPAPTFPQDVATAETIAPAEPVPSASNTLPTLDRKRYRVVDEVGRGGLGRILRARDEVLGRPVAVKELLAPDEGAQARFVREALITARLQHPAIVPIYDAGQSDAQGPFYAMKLVAGRSLAEELQGKRTFEERIAVLPSVIAVVDAMAYAHSEKIIHRDLKPQNVLVGKYGETVLIDWGLAKDLSATEAEQRGPYRASGSSVETMDGAVMGTPAFMPPEQAAGEDVDERADVYALGAMLYFVIAGVAPHSGRSMDDMLLKIVSGDIVPVQEREPKCPADLAAIVTKAMMKDAAQRYRDAGALADDLKKFQTGQLVGAHEYTLGERFRRWLRRHKASVAVSTIAAAILIVYGIWSVLQIRERRAEAERAAAIAAKQRDAAVAQAMLVRARQYAATGHTAEEIAMLRALARPGAAPEARRLAIEDGGLIWKSHQRLAMALGQQVGLAYRSADGARFVASEPGALVAWDVATGKELARLAISGSEPARFGRVLAISPGAKFALVTECTQPGENCGITNLGDRMIALKSATRVEVRELATGKSIEQFAPPAHIVMRAIAFAPDDAAFAIRRGDRVKVIGAGAREVATGACEGALAVASNGTLAIACSDHVLIVKPDGAAAQVLRGTPPDQLAFVTSDRLVAIGEEIQLFDVARGELRGAGELPKLDVGDEDELDDIRWSYVPPVKSAAKHRFTQTPEIRIGSATYILPRTSVLPPPPRLVSNGAVITVEGTQWQTLLIADDLARLAMVDVLVPPQPPGRCLPRVGGERHATTVLDNGERMLVDEQEVPLGLALAPPEGYRHTTAAEAPVRQLRPLLAAEADACLVWGPAVGARALDAGAIPALAGVAAGPDGGIVVVGAREAFRIDRDGKRTNIAASDDPAISPTGTHVASFDAGTATITISSIATGKAVRTWTAPAEAELSRSIRWVAADVVGIGAQLVPVDAKLPVRQDDLIVAPRSTLGLRRTDHDVTVVRVADGTVLAKHALPSAQLLPDDSARIVHRPDKQYVVVAPDGSSLALAGERYVERFEVHGNAIVGRDERGIVAWDAATGSELPLAESTHAAIFLDDETWSITGHRKPRLVRKRRDGSIVKELALSTAGLAFHHAADEIELSPDRRRIAARYAVTEALFAYAMWDAETGVLLWVGPPTASIFGDWVVAGGHVYRPLFDLDAVLRDTGTRTNLRVCEKDLRVVPVVPPPPPDTYWAPASSCR